jgi:hypothetical protein
VSGSYCPSPAKHGTYPGRDKGRYREERYAERYKMADDWWMLTTHLACAALDETPSEPDACTREVPPVQVRTTDGPLTTPRALLTLTFGCILVGCGHMLFGHPATGVSFFLLAVVGVMATLTMRSAREGQWS